MPQSLTDVCIHLTFSTYLRKLFLDAGSRETVFRYITGIIRNLRGSVLAIGGADDHVHILFRMPKDVTLAETIRTVKGSSSRFLKASGTKHRAFSWQSGYFAQSVSPNDTDRVVRYIKDQERHHRTESYQQEILRMLREAGTDFDENYLWD